VTGGEDDMDLTAAGDFSLDDVLRGSSDVPLMVSSRASLRT
jgi:hypothetical protein